MEISIRLVPLLRRLLLKATGRTYRSKGDHHIIVTEQSSPWPANEQPCRIEYQTQGHRERCSDRDYRTAVSRIDHGARPHVVTAEDHGGGGIAWMQEDQDPSKHTGAIYARLHTRLI